jgi:hypothetical protein
MKGRKKTQLSVSLTPLSFIEKHVCIVVYTTGRARAMNTTETTTTTVKRGGGLAIVTCVHAFRCVRVM